MNDTQRKAITDLRLKGCSYSQISIKVGLSENTIKTFCRRNNLKAEDIASAIGPKEGVCECCGKPTVLIEGKKPKRFCSSSCRNKWWNSNLDKVNKKANYELLVSDAIRLLQPMVIREENTAVMSAMWQIGIMEGFKNGRD